MKNEGRGGGGQVVSMLTFHADDLSSNSADAYSFLKKTENNKKRH